MQALALRLCTDYRPIHPDSHNWNLIWFTRRQLNKLRQAAQIKVKKKQPSKECIEYALHIAESVYPITSDTFDWQFIYFTKKQLNEFIMFCQTQLTQTNE